MADHTLDKLAAIIKSRRAETGSTSYTRQLLDAGTGKCAKKFGEEAAEAIIAAVSQDEKALKAEAADVLYHLLVMLESRGVAFADVLAELEARTRQSGLAEKASRSGGGS